MKNLKDTITEKLRLDKNTQTFDFSVYFDENAGTIKQFKDCDVYRGNSRYTKYKYNNNDKILQNMIEKHFDDNDIVFVVKQSDWRFKNIYKTTFDFILDDELREEAYNNKQECQRVSLIDYKCGWYIKTIGEFTMLTKRYLYSEGVDHVEYIIKKTK